MKNIRLKIFIIGVLLLLSSTMYAQASNNRGTSSFNSIGLITGEDYVTGQDGIPRITLNIFGHVRYPGTYLIYDSVDLLTALSTAGGPLKGAKLSKIKIISKDGKLKIINLEDLIEQQNISSIKLSPYDTIYIDETFGSYILSKSNAFNVLIQITNLLIIAFR